MDKVVLEGMQFCTHHGVDDAEQELGQLLVVNLEMELDLAAAGESDELTQTVNYAAVYARVAETVTTKSYRLLEKVAEGVARAILDDYLMVQRVKVRIMKPHPPIPGILSAAGVEIIRERNA